MTATHTPEAHATRQAWAGGVMAFGAVMLLLASMLAIFRGIMAIAKDNVFVNTRNYVFEFDLTSWGWIHLVLGAIGVGVSLGLFQAATWARVAGVGIAGLVIIATFLSLPYYPVWSVVVIAFSGFIIWALCAVDRKAFYTAYERQPHDV